MGEQGAELNEKARGTCALEGCDRPLPPPARDEHGKLKGGKPSRYCGKAHADEASRRRRALEAAGVEEPLRMLHELGAETRTVVQSLLTELGFIGQRWGELDEGAVAQSAIDRAEKSQALLRVEQAENQAAAAERERTDALAEAKEHRERRAEAERAADDAHNEADRVQRETWERITAHERARGQAETRASIAEQAWHEAEARLEGTAHELQELRTSHDQLDRQLTEAHTQVERAESALRLAESQAEAAMRRAAISEDATLRAQSEATAVGERLERAEFLAEEATDEARGLRERVRTAATELNTANTDLKLAEQRIEDLQSRLEESAKREKRLAADLSAALGKFVPD